jgi:hypothetical protein
MIEDGELIEKLPSLFGDHGDIPKDLIGATILRMGTLPGLNVEGGGLVIDYRPRNSQETNRVVFGFNELGMWVQSQGLATPCD